ncbi:hypothetical protein RB614_21890 [Phytohabitans sp. ZYX-F-186]|uniref:Uncharacterized protein n=1 Tax=Phytohabitans maris TaxID=3071409 RepID=A0ABU0ZJE5_9ACTN|nr:hypothetical protein [Phytohabitans sp. ZYX-F-186]MDQ7907168.1 hypothetical protein [Phytohabitans sp. ZYX-F-186]
MRALTGLLGAWAIALAFAGQPAEVAVAVAVGLLAVAVAGHLAGALRAIPERPVGWTAAPVRSRAAVPRYVDPDAAGRPRPRRRSPGCRSGITSPTG